MVVEADGQREAAGPRTWLLSKGWMRHGRIELNEIPGAA